MLPCLEGAQSTGAVVQSAAECSLLYIYQEGWQADILLFVVMSDHRGRKVALIGQGTGLLC